MISSACTGAGGRRRMRGAGVAPVPVLNIRHGAASNGARQMDEDLDHGDDAADRALVARWQGGDDRAATAIVERHAPALARFAASQGARDGVDELVQDTF